MKADWKKEKRSSLTFAGGGGVGRDPLLKNKAQLNTSAPLSLPKQWRGPCSWRQIYSALSEAIVVTKQITADFHQLLLYCLTSFPGQQCWWSAWAVKHN